VPFEKLTEMILPRIVIGGHGAIEKIGEVYEKVGGAKKCVIVTGDVTLKLAGNKVFEILSSMNIDIKIINVGKATDENVEMVKSEAKKFGAETIIGVGGGQRLIFQRKLLLTLALILYLSPRQQAMMELHRQGHP
jgi:Glycerol dehydrogenase and related enzymes